MSLPLQDSFFTYHRSQDFFKDKFPLQEFFLGMSPHLRLFLTPILKIIGLTAQYLP